MPIYINNEDIASNKAANLPRCGLVAFFSSTVYLELYLGTVFKEQFIDSLRN